METEIWVGESTQTEKMNGPSCSVKLGTIEQEADRRAWRSNVASEQTQRGPFATLKAEVSAIRKNEFSLCAANCPYEGG